MIFKLFFSNSLCTDCYGGPSSLPKSNISIGRDEFCGLRFVTIKVGTRTNQATGGSREFKKNSMKDLHIPQNVPHSKKRLRYCYECGRSIGKQNSLN